MHVNSVLFYWILSLFKTHIALPKSSFLPEPNEQLDSQKFEHDFYARLKT